MSNAKERKCIIDGTIYKYCPHCSNYNSNEKWRLIYCSENCMNIHKVYDAYKAKKIDKVEAKNRLAECDLSNYGNISAFIKEVLDEVVESEKAVKEVVTEESQVEADDIVNED